MKYILVMTLILTSCSHYATTKLSNNSVHLNKTTVFLGLFTFATVYTCKLDDLDMITHCEDNDVEDKLWSMTKKERAEYYERSAREIKSQKFLD